MGAQSSDMPGHRTIGSAWLWAILLVGLAALSPHRLAAQSPSAADSAVQVGDRWTYESKDEISGEPKDAYTQLVTEISPKEIVVNVSTRGKSGSSIIIYDHDWNRIATSTLKFQPNDGQGIRLPLAVA